METNLHALRVSCRAILLVAFIARVCCGQSPPEQARSETGQSKQVDEASANTGDSGASDEAGAAHTGFDEYVHCDFLDLQIDLSVDVARQSIDVKSRLAFQLPLQGKPLWDLKPEVTRYRVDESAWLPGPLEVVRSPDQQSTFRTIRETLSADNQHTIELEYELTANNTPECRFECSVVPIGSTRKLIPAIQSFDDSRQFDFLMAVMDYDPRTYRTDGRTFLERYIPSSLESDQHRLQINVTLNGTDAPHRILANGTVNGMQVTFSEHTTCSSAFFHLVPESRYFITETHVQAAGRTIPVTVYSTVAAGGDFHYRSVKNVRRNLLELIEEIGFYPHDHFLAHLYPRSGGMEYAGATSCGPGALRHEIFHSWFGRGVRPIDGNAGWIDEAITTWWIDGRAAIDNDPPNSESVYRRTPTPLSTLYPWLRMTPSGAYGNGSRFIRFVASEYARQASDLKPVLIEFAKSHMHQPVSTEVFLAYLREKAPEGVQLDDAIAYYIYAQQP